MRRITAHMHKLLGMLVRLRSFCMTEKWNLHDPNAKYPG